MTSAMQRDTIDTLVAELFTADAASHPDGSIGAELELIPVRVRGHARVGIADSAAGRGTASIARAAAHVAGWSEETDPYGAPAWRTADGGRICFEPGGQFEICSPVCESPAILHRFIASVVALLRESAASEGVALLATGVDPYNAIEDVPVELHAPRYDTMLRHFDSIGPSGARMMRQTASLQVNVELGADPLARWSLLNALAPYLTAMYANSPVYAGSATGFASYRAHLWQTLDPSRTGIPFDAVDPVGRYAEFARGAYRMASDDRTHLSTLFPEVRPRRYFELRSMDAMEPDAAGEALHMLWSLIHGADVSAELARVLGAPDEELLHRAARSGRRDRLLAERVAIIESLAARG